VIEVDWWLKFLADLISWLDLFIDIASLSFDLLVDSMLE